MLDGSDPAERLEDMSDKFMNESGGPDNELMDLDINFGLDKSTQNLMNVIGSESLSKPSKTLSGRKGLVGLDLAGVVSRPVKAVTKRSSLMKDFYPSSLTGRSKLKKM